MIRPNAWVASKVKPRHREAAASSQSPAACSGLVTRAYKANCETTWCLAEIISASARRKRARPANKQVEKRHAHDPHWALRGNWSMITPSRTVAVAKKPQMILNSEVMGDERQYPRK